MQSEFDRAGRGVKSEFGLPGRGTGQTDLWVAHILVESKRNKPTLTPLTCMMQRRGVSRQMVLDQSTNTAQQMLSSSGWPLTAVR